MKGGGGGGAGSPVPLGLPLVCTCKVFSCHFLTLGCAMITDSSPPICRFDFSQEYIPHGYKELCLAPTQDGEV